MKHYIIFDQKEIILLLSPKKQMQGVRFIRIFAFKARITAKLSPSPMWWTNIALKKPKKSGILIAYWIKFP